MENIYLAAGVLLILAALCFLIHYLTTRSNTKIKRCVHFTAYVRQGATGIVKHISGKYYFKGISHEHEIRAKLIVRLYNQGYYLEDENFVALVHIAKFTWPDRKLAEILLLNKPTA